MLNVIDDHNHIIFRGIVSQIRGAGAVKKAPPVHSNSPNIQFALISGQQRGLA